jgi:hypothetical protein
MINALTIYIGINNISRAHFGQSGDCIVRQSANATSHRNRENPRPDDIDGYAPSDSAEAAHGTEAHNGSRNGVRGTYGDACGGSGEERRRRSRLGTESAERIQFSNL